LVGQKADVEERGEIEDIEAGITNELTVSLRPGTYVLHLQPPRAFMAGMAITVTVT
jgi:hypothetical protein